MVQFNKMFVMLPVMFFARKLDGEDPNVVYWLRVAYAAIQVVHVLLVIYMYLQAQKVKADRVIYVPPPAVPFADPNARKKYTEIAFNAHVLSTARSLVGSTLFGILMTVGLHYYKGMVMGLAIQTVMAPFNLAENALFKAMFMGAGIRPEDRIFEEKYLNELTAEDEVVDEQGQPVLRRAAVTNQASEKAQRADSNMAVTQSFEEIMLDTWDAGAKSDISSLMEALTKKNCNYQTKEDRWTPLMILSGLGAKGTGSAIRQAIKELGANPSITDKDGWNALHWAAFHGSAAGAKELVKEKRLLSVKDKEGLTPLETARKEKNDTIAAIIEAAETETKKSK